MSIVRPDPIAFLSSARINDCMARKIPYTFQKDVAPLGEPQKSRYKAITSTLNRSTPDDDAPDAAGDSWIFKLRK